MLQVLVSAFPLAAMYALVAVGFVIVYRSSRVLNFAQGQLTLLGAYLCYSGVSLFGGHFYPGFLVACLASVAIGVVIYRVFLRSFTALDPLLGVMITIVLATLIGSAYAMAWGTSPLPLAEPFVSHGIHFGGGVVLTTLDLATVATAVVIIGSLLAVLRWTRFGLAMRAAAESPALASYRSVNVSRVAAVSWAIAVASAAVAGIAYSLQSEIDPSSIALGVATFPAILIGGLDSIGGVLIGSLVLAVIDQVITTYVGGNWTDAIAYLILLAVLLVRPNGLFGSKVPVRL
ncbi:MAG: branched-chain amino acid ABC transporter permease [Acidimicrobiales bacterium]